MIRGRATEQCGLTTPSAYRIILLAMEKQRYPTLLEVSFICLLVLL